MLSGEGCQPGSGDSHAGHATLHTIFAVRDDSAGPPRPEGGVSTQLRLETNAIVVPPGGRATREPCGVLTQHGLVCSAAVHWRNRHPLTLTPKSSQLRGGEATLGGRWLWGGVLFDHFGHFMVESLGRLWPLQNPDFKVDGVVFIPKRSGRRANGKLRPWQADVLSMMAPNLPIRIAQKVHRVEQLIVPGQGFGLGWIIQGTAHFRRAVDSMYGVQIEPTGGKKIYLSRSKLRGKGGLLHELRIEAAMAAEGYDILHPQEMPIAEQISRFKAADFVVAAEGSALHHFAFVAQLHQKVAILVRRQSAMTWQIREHIFRFSRRVPVLILASRGLWAPSETAPGREVVCDPDFIYLREVLMEHGFIEGIGNWDPPTQDDTKAVLDLIAGRGGMVRWRGPERGLQDIKLEA